MDDYTKRAVEVFRECARIPLLSSAAVFSHRDGGKYEVLSKWNQRELERGKKVAFTRSFFLEKNGGRIEKLASSMFQSDTSNQIKVSHALLSGTKAVLVKEKPANGKPGDESQQYIEVWSGEGLEKTVAVADLKKHGKIHEDIHFGSFHLSANGQKLLFIAEKEKPKRTSFFKKTPAKSEDEKAPVQGAEYVAEDDWGEQLTSVVDPVVVVMSVKSEECEVVEIGDDVSAGQAVWVPEEGGEVVCVGWENKPRKLGFVYCLNRPSALYHMHLGSGKSTPLTGKDECVFSPRFSPQGDKLVYFQTPGGGPHRSCALLKMINWSNRQIVTVVDVVQRPSTVGGFPGFYSTWLPERCWDAAGKTIFCSENWGSHIRVVQVDVGSGEVRGVSNEEGAWSVMCVSHDLIVAQHASLSQTPRLMVGVVSSDMSHNVTWTEISPPPVSMVTEGVTWKVLSFTPDPGSVPYEAILVNPRPSPTKPPLAVYPHGGPHGVIPADFLVWPVCLASLGTAVLLVNYRGSTGYGQDSIDCLLGKIGRQDVDDVQRAAEAVVRGGEVDGERVCVLGGSHGGFLSLHLVAQFPVSPPLPHPAPRTSRWRRTSKREHLVFKTLSCTLNMMHWGKV
jgi:acylaminoacyl-peptidase